MAVVDDVGADAVGVGLSKKSEGRALLYGFSCGSGGVGADAGAASVSGCVGSISTAARASSFVLPSKNPIGSPFVVFVFLCVSWSTSSSSSDSALRFLPFEAETLRREGSGGCFGGRAIGSVLVVVLASCSRCRFCL